MIYSRLELHYLPQVTLSYLNALPRVKLIISLLAFGLGTAYLNHDQNLLLPFLEYKK